MSASVVSRLIGKYSNSRLHNSWKNNTILYTYTLPPKLSSEFFKKLLNETESVKFLAIVDHHVKTTVICYPLIVFAVPFYVSKKNLPKTERRFVTVKYPARRLGTRPGGGGPF